MKTYFAGIRKWCAAMAWAVPLLNAATILLLALGARYWALIPWLIGAVAAVSFPSGLQRSASTSGKGEPLALRLLPLPGMILIYLWVIRQPEMVALYERVLSGSALRHWLVAAGVGLLTAAAIYRRQRAIRQLSDEEIYQFYESSVRGQR